MLRNKRLFDISWAVVCLLTLPFTFWSFISSSGIVKNILATISGRKTWVSYGSPNSNLILPPLRPGILAPAFISYRENDAQAKVDADYYYARDYSVWKDLSLVINNFRNLGGTYFKIEN